MAHKQHGHWDGCPKWKIEILLVGQAQRDKCTKHHHIALGKVYRFGGFINWVSVIHD